MLKYIPLAAVLLMTTNLFADPPAQPRIRISAWYWLNSAPKDEWKRDFTDMKQMGFTDVLICWGVDISAVKTRKSDTHQALQWAHDAGLGVYLLIWHPNANSLPRKDEFMQVNSDGKQLDSCDVFNPAWRSTQWKDYLTDVIQTYKDEPAITGYAFDDSFGGGNISYGDYEKKTFGEPLPKKPGDPRWEQWLKTRQGWWDDWARDTVADIRAVDPDPNHVIYIEDNISTIATHLDNMGLDFAGIAKYFDAVGGYAVPHWTAAPDSDAKALQLTDTAINDIRKLGGPDKKIIFTFWSANILEERKPGPATHPTAAEIQDVCQEALKLNVRFLDMYGYRIGEYRVSKEDRTKVVPPEPAPYQLTGQFPHKFMWDRPKIHEELAKYLHSLNEQ